MNVETKLDIHEINGKDCESNEETLSIKNHWNVRKWIILEYKNIELTVNAYDLEKAIQNATNWL